MCGGIYIIAVPGAEDVRPITLEFITPLSSHYHNALTFDTSVGKP